MPRNFASLDPYRACDLAKQALAFWRVESTPDPDTFEESIRFSLRRSSSVNFFFDFGEQTFCGKFGGIFFGGSKGGFL